MLATIRAFAAHECAAVRAIAALRRVLLLRRDSAHRGRHAAHGGARCAILRRRSAVYLGAVIAHMASLLYVL